MFYHVGMVATSENQDELVYKQYKLLPDFKNFLLAGNVLSKNTIKNYLSDIRHYFGYVQAYHPEKFEGYDFSNGDVLYEYRQFLVKSVHSNITVKRRLSAIQKFLVFFHHTHQAALEDPRASVQDGTISSRTPLDRSNYYLNSILQEYVREKNIPLDQKKNVRDFLLFMHK